MHSHIDSKFGMRSTAADVVAGLNLSGKTTLITGGTSGLGQETARVLAVAGARVVFTGRDVQKGQAIEKALGQQCGHEAAKFIPLDLMSADAVADFGTQMRAEHHKLDMLILNAGVMTPVLQRNDKGIEAQFMTNYAGHLLLADILTPSLIAAAPARVVTLTSSGHKLAPVDFDDINFEKRAYDGLKSYGQSKTAASLLAVELNRRLAAQGVLAFSVHPGVILETDLSRHSGGRQNEEAQIAKYGVPRWALKTLGEGAATSVWAATAPELASSGGGLYLEDCQIAEVSEANDPYKGVLPRAFDGADATRLWTLTEAMLDQKSAT